MTKPLSAVRLVVATALAAGLPLLLGAQLASAAGFPGDGGAPAAASDSGQARRPVAGSPCAGKDKGDGPQLLRTPSLEVLPDTPAAAAGLAQGDEIVAVGGKQVGPEGSLAELIAEYNPGDKVTLDVRTGDSGATRSVEVTLGRHPQEPERPFLGVAIRPPFTLEIAPGAGAMRWRDAPEGQAPPWSDLPNKAAYSAPAVMEVVPGGPAAAAGLAPGDSIVAVDGTAVSSPADIARALADAAPGDRIRLEVRRARSKDTTILDVTLGSRPDDDAAAYLGALLGRVMTWRFSGPAPSSAAPDLGDTPAPALPGAGAVPGITPPGAGTANDLSPAGEDASGARWQHRFRAPQRNSAAGERSA